MTNFKPVYFTLGALVLFSGAMAFADEAEAQVRDRKVTVSNSQGRTATKTTQVSRTDRTRQKTSTVETGAGYGGTRTVEQGYDPETGRYSSGSVTTNSGATASREKSANCVDGACSRSTTYTGPEGQTVTTGATRYVDDNGVYVKEQQATGPNGETATREVTRNGEGEKTTTVTGPEGETRSRSRWITVE